MTGSRSCVERPTKVFANKTNATTKFCRANTIQSGYPTDSITMGLGVACEVNGRLANVCATNECLKGHSLVSPPCIAAVLLAFRIQSASTFPERLPFSYLLGISG